MLSAVKPSWGSAFSTEDIGLTFPPHPVRKPVEICGFAVIKHPDKDAIGFLLMFDVDVPSETQGADFRQMRNDHRETAFAAESSESVRFEDQTAHASLRIQETAAPVFKAVRILQDHVGTG